MRDTVCFSWYSDMSMRTIACSSSNRNSASARASSVLPTPVGPRNRKLPSGRFGSCSPARARRIAFDDRGDRLVLADDALVQPLLHLNQLLDFAFHQPADRDVRPLADDLGDVFLVDFLLQHPLALLQLGQLRFLLLDLAFELRDLAVLQLRRLLVVAGALRALDLEPQRSPAPPSASATAECSSFSCCQCAASRPRSSLRSASSFSSFAEPLLRRLVALLAQRLALDLELHDAALELVELRRHRVDLHPQLRRRLVDQIDRLVGQEPIGDVAVGEDRRRHQRARP